MVKISTVHRFFVAALVSKLEFLLTEAVQASPRPHQRLQPDGSPTPPLYLKGDERHHYLSDANGFTVIQDSDGWYVYAMHDENGELTSTTARVARTDPFKLGIPNLNGIVFPTSVGEAEIYHRGLQENAQKRRQAFEYAGTANDPHVLKVLVVLLRFSDHEHRILPSHTAYHAFYNEPGGHEIHAPTGSVRDVWFHNSHGKFTMDSYVTTWIDLPYTEAYYANNNWGYKEARTKEAFYFGLSQLETVHNVDLKQFDNNNDGILDAVEFVHSGIGSEMGVSACDVPQEAKNMIWSHKSNGKWYTQDGSLRLKSYFVASGVTPTDWDRKNKCFNAFDITRIGVHSHELGHHIGIADLYDSDSSPGNGIGKWDFMASSWGWDSSDYYPPHLSPWTKKYMGWVTEVELNQAGEHTLIQSCDTDVIYVIKHNFPGGEYLILENRQPVMFDHGIPGGGGLAIWHIDEIASVKIEGYPEEDNNGVQTGNWVGEHYKHALLQADGNYDLERGTNKGDSTDLFKIDFDGAASSIGPDGITVNGIRKLFPNTDSYQGGTFVSTGLTISVVSPPGPTMTIHLSGDGLLEQPVTSLSTSQTAGPTKAPTDDPTNSPTEVPTKSSTDSSTKAPTDAPTRAPTNAPTKSPAYAPTKSPTYSPTKMPTNAPTEQPPVPVEQGLTSCTDGFGGYNSHQGAPKKCTWMSTLRRRRRNCGWNSWPITDLGQNCPHTCRDFNSCQ